MPLRFQFSLRAFLVLPVVVGAFFAGERYGRSRENYRVNRIQDIRDELNYLAGQGPVSPKTLQEMRELEDELRSLFQ